MLSKLENILKNHKEIITTLVSLVGIVLAYLALSPAAKITPSVKSSLAKTTSSNTNKNANESKCFNLPYYGFLKEIGKCKASYESPSVYPDYYPVNKYTSQKEWEWALHYSVGSDNYLRSNKVCNDILDKHKYVISNALRLKAEKQCKNFKVPSFIREFYVKNIRSHEEKIFSNSMKFLNKNFDYKPPIIQLSEDCKVKDRDIIEVVNLGFRLATLLKSISISVATNHTKTHIPHLIKGGDAQKNSSLSIPMTYQPTLVKEPFHPFEHQFTLDRNAFEGARIDLLLNNYNEEKIFNWFKQIYSLIPSKMGNKIKKTIQYLINYYNLNLISITNASKQYTKYQFNTENRIELVGAKFFGSYPKTNVIWQNCTENRIAKFWLRRIASKTDNKILRLFKRFEKEILK